VVEARELRAQQVMDAPVAEAPAHLGISTIRPAGSRVAAFRVCLDELVHLKSGMID
jgi:hypothetical protein